MKTIAVLAPLLTLSFIPPFVVAYPADTEHLHRGQNLERADAVKQAFRHAWTGYMQYAFPNDELHPVSNGFGNSRNRWGASAVDALSTALIMDLPDVVNVVLDHVDRVDYSQTDSQVSLFETTIRYLGGMISAYDLLMGPLSHLAPDRAKVNRLLEQSVALADVMKFAFQTRSGVPSNDINIVDQTTDGATTNGLATTGTLVLEWTRLSNLTGNLEYATLAQRGEQHLLRPRPATSEPFPGLIGYSINIDSGEIESNQVSWGGGHDSYYEYLIKMYVYDRNRYGEYRERWIAAAESSMRYLASSPPGRPNLMYLADYDGANLRKNSGHLTCFHGGNFILGGQVLGRQDLIDFGLRLVEGCYQTYHSTTTRIGPEGYSWDENSVPASQRSFYNANGFYITNRGYNLRPEVLESYYYAYRATGNSMYQDWAWEAFEAITRYTRTGSGFTAIRDVMAPGGGQRADNQESFFFAEVLKYAYMIFVPDGEWQVARDGNNRWVYNTEAHPFRVFGA